MTSSGDRRSSHRSGDRCGLTLVELLIAVAIIAMTAASLAALARATQISASYVQGHSAAAQHARVTAERIEQAIHSATASESFPGAAVFAETVGGNRFPDTLVVWHPTAGTVAVDPGGLPRFSELVVFCPNPSQPDELLEITSRSDTRTVPPLASTSQWATELNALKTGSTSKKVLLTDLLRTARTSSTAGLRGCVRFEVLLRPSKAQFDDFRDGDLDWNDIKWPQNWYGDTTGVRQTWVRWELQLMPDSRADGAAADPLAVPFPGSAALYYDIQR